MVDRVQLAAKHLFSVLRDALEQWNAGRGSFEQSSVVVANEECGLQRKQKINWPIAGRLSKRVPYLVSLHYKKEEADEEEEALRTNGDDNHHQLVVGQLEIN
jgi:hypothetical protein